MSHGRVFVPGAREKLLALLSAPPAPVEHDGGSPADSTPLLPQELWSGVLGVILESAYEQHDWNLATALVSAGARIGACDLHAAAQQGRRHLAVALVENGASVDADDELGRTPLHIAAQHDRVMMALFLKQSGANADKRDEKGRTPLFVAAESGSPRVVRLLMASGAKPDDQSNDYTFPLVVAAENGHDEVVRAMIELGVDANAANSFGETALHAARGETMANMLIRAGADIEARDYQGKTPLNTMCAEGESIETIRALLDHGASINTQDDSGETPLHSVGDAPDTPHKNSGAERMSLLLRFGASETIANQYGETPLDQLPDESEDSENRFKCMRKLLANAPADRAWRRRGLLLLCVARHRRRVPPSLQSACILAGLDEKERSSIEHGNSGSVAEKAFDDWGGVATWILGLGLGKEGIFRTIVGYL